MPNVVSKLSSYSKEYRQEYVKRNAEKLKAQRHTYYLNNKEAEYKNSNDWRVNNPEKYESNRMMRMYGITLDTWNAMFDAQEGCCAICGTHQSELKGSLHIDHCHDTKVVRGLLCTRCNTALGLFKDDTNILEKASVYLNSFKE